WMRRVEAVRGVSFEVQAGDIFGFLGPNGAGKTTTIKMLTGLIAPTSGRASLMGEPVGRPRVLSKVGFLPENPYVYPYLTPLEFVEMCGELSGLRGRACRDRARQVLERTGVWYAADRQVRRLSKGMLQRTGLAAALVADPELLILDEPMSGLDPVGRKEVKDLILEERANGRTIFFSTHILADVEALCDRVTILRKGQVVVSGALSELLNFGANETQIVLDAVSEELQGELEALGGRLSRAGERTTVEVASQQVDEVLRMALGGGASVVEVQAHHATLEDLFVREAIFSGDRSDPEPAKKSSSD
ncbi:MAG: ABC transporter ATP-binding protein, partial [Myxococcales bacterium]|nr:ABC transporter ATP-binding protein [Myxococcales bacterium]